ncbi:btb/poz domain-containing [Anaeramoeba ignava]|uniref:Btb/poz domain-containing n=1 Tax=Anaeramoeba ignava TaxID=1746090 RepID=A0A9Q0RDI7_ANAIG|nr:btb/poz domain-containing [Anaeramoeba ignava]
MISAVHSLEISNLQIYKEEKLEDKFKKYINNPLFSDVCFKVGKTEQLIYAHKFVLATTSEVWAVQLFGSFQEAKQDSKQPILVPDIEADVFLSLLTYAYTSHIELTQENAVGVLYASNKYNLPSLRKYCGEYLSALLNAENCCDLLQHALTVKEESLIKQSISCIQNNSYLVLAKSDGVLGLTEETLLMILSLENLIGISEIDIFRACIKWAKNQCNSLGIKPRPENLRKLLENIMKHIKFSLMSKMDLEEVMETKTVDPDAMLQICFEILNKAHTQRFRERKQREEIKVMVISAESNSSWRRDVELQLRHGGFKNVEMIRGEMETPSFEQMANYDCIFTFSQMNYHNEKLLGDNLAEFVKSGGGLVVATFSTEKESLEIKGKIFEEAMLPFISGEKSYGESQVIGNFDRQHPLMENVFRFSGGSSSYRSKVQTNVGATLVACWGDGVPLIGEKRMNSRCGVVVELNFFPVSSNCRSDFWDVTTDGAVIICNAVQFVSAH